MQRLAHVRGGADRVAHVVQAVEERDEVVVRARDTPWPSRPRSATRSATPASARALARALDRRARGSRSRRTSTSDRPSPSGSSTRRDRSRRRRPGALLELRLDAVERRNPRRSPGWRCSRAGRSARCPRRDPGRARASRRPCRCGRLPRPSAAAFIAAVIAWKPPSTNAGLVSSASASACSGREGVASVAAS